MHWSVGGYIYWSALWPHYNSNCFNWFMTSCNTLTFTLPCRPCHKCNHVPKNHIWIVSWNWVIVWKSSFSSISVLLSVRKQKNVCCCFFLLFFFCFFFLFVFWVLILLWSIFIWRRKLYWKNVNRKVQGVPQSQTVANPRYQEKEKKDKNKQTNAREAHRPALSSPSEVITMLKGMKKHENKEQGKTLKHEAPRSINHKATQNKKKILKQCIQYNLCFDNIHPVSFSIHPCLKPISMVWINHRNQLWR